MTRFIPLHEVVTLIGSGEIGLSHYLDSHVYLLHGDGEYALVDAGSGIEPDYLIENVRLAIGDLSRLRYILLTHCHGDHAGGVHAFQKVTGARVVSSEWEMEMLARGSDEDLGLVQARFAGTYPPEFGVTRTRGDLVLKHGGELSLGKLRIRALITPGHTRESVCYLVDGTGETLLFSGDTVFWGGLIQLLNTPGSEISVYRRGVGSLGDLKVDCLFPGHGLWALRKGQSHIDKMLYYFRRSAVPPMPAFVEKIKG